MKVQCSYTFLSTAVHKEKQGNLNADVFTVENKNSASSPLRQLTPLLAPIFPSLNLSAIKYVDFSVYILACVPYLVGKQNIEYVRRSTSKKGLCFLSVINSFCVPDMTIFCRPIKALSPAFSSLRC